MHEYALVCMRGVCVSSSVGMFKQGGELSVRVTSAVMITNVSAFVVMNGPGLGSMSPLSASLLLVSQVAVFVIRWCGGIFTGHIGLGIDLGRRGEGGSMCLLWVVLVWGGAAVGWGGPGGPWSVGLRAAGWRHLPPLCVLSMWGPLGAVGVVCACVCEWPAGMHGAVLAGAVVSSSCSFLVGAIGVLCVRVCGWHVGSHSGSLVAIVVSSSRLWPACGMVVWHSPGVRACVALTRSLWPAVCSLRLPSAACSPSIASVAV